MAICASNPHQYTGQFFLLPRPCASLTDNVFATDFWGAIWSRFTLFRGGSQPSDKMPKRDTRAKRPSGLIVGGTVQQH